MIIGPGGSRPTRNLAKSKAVFKKISHESRMAKETSHGGTWEGNFKIAGLARRRARSAAEPPHWARRLGRDCRPAANQSSAVRPLSKRSWRRLGAACSETGRCRLRVARWRRAELHRVDAAARGADGASE